LRGQSPGAAIDAHARHQGALQEVVVVTPDSKHDLPIAENLLAHDFTPAAPDRVWIGDVTCIALQEGWHYRAVVMGLFNRQRLSWRMRSRMQASVVTHALCMASFRRHPPSGLIFHSDAAAQTAVTRSRTDWSATAGCRP